MSLSTAFKFGVPLAAVVAILVLVIMWQDAASRAETANIELSAVTGERNGLQKRNDLLERAALERFADERAIDTMGKELNDAIKDIPAGTAPSPAAVSLGCIRLRQAGSTTSDAFKRICGGR